MEKELNIPNHVAIILDGNGRWAKKHGVPRVMGHKKGCEAVENIVTDCADLGIGYLTVYAFSTENWKRSVEEVTALMDLFRVYLKKLLKMALEKNARLRFIGERSRLDQDIRNLMDDMEDQTKENTGLTFTIAVNYGSRDEILRAFNRIQAKIEAGEMAISDVTEQTIADNLDTAGMPDPDLLIRTGSELRLSNYLLYQSAYTELYVTDTLWPDFDKEALLLAIEDFSHRTRKFGGRNDEA